MTNEEFNDLFRNRTKKFALQIIAFLESVPFNTATRVMSYQLSKSGTSVGANFRAFCRGRSAKERFAKICIVVEEADETLYWLELFNETSYSRKYNLKPIMDEGIEIIKVTTSIKDTIYKQL